MIRFELRLLELDFCSLTGQQHTRITHPECLTLDETLQFRWGVALSRDSALLQGKSLFFITIYCSHSYDGRSLFNIRC